MVKYLWLIIVIGACTPNGKDTTRLDSDDFSSKKDRVDKLNLEIKAFSEIIDAEFELFNVNGFSNERTTIPGASSWDYKFAVKVKQTDIPKWTEGMTSVSLPGYDDQWIEEIIKHRKKNWETTEEPSYYKRDESVTMIVHPQEGIIFKRVLNL